MIHQIHILSTASTSLFLDCHSGCCSQHDEGQTFVLSWLNANIHKCVLKVWSHSVSEKFFLDSCPWKRMVFDRAADIFAEITVISTGPNMTQFVCFFHIKEQFIPQCLHQTWANILIGVETFVLFFFSCTFAPSLRNPGRAESTRTYQAWRSLDHTQRSMRISLPAQLLCLFYFYLPTSHLILVVSNGVRICSFSLYFSVSVP